MDNDVNKNGKRGTEECFDCIDGLANGFGFSPDTKKHRNSGSRSNTSSCSKRPVYKDVSPASKCSRPGSLQGLVKLQHQDRKLEPGQVSVKQGSELMSDDLESDTIIAADMCVEDIDSPDCSKVKTWKHDLKSTKKVSVYLCLIRVLC